MNIPVFPFALPPIFWIFIVIALFVYFLKTPTGKGMKGELIVNILLRFHLDKNTYHLIKNVTLPAESGTTQIDHIIVSKYGIFVVETKNMKGWILGSERQKNWMQIIYRYKGSFQNPLHQNYKHTKTLESLLQIDPKKIFSLIVFVGDSEFKTEMPDNVTDLQGFIRYIKSKNEILFNPLTVKNIVERIGELRLKENFQTHRNHVRYLQSLHSGGAAVHLRGTENILTSLKESIYWEEIQISAILISIFLFSLLAFSSFPAIFHAGEKIISEVTQISSKKEPESNLGNTPNREMQAADHVRQPQKYINYAFSPSQIKQAKEVLLKDSDETIYFSEGHNSGVRFKKEKGNQRYLYEIMLRSGERIHSNNIIIGKKIIFMDRGGLIVSINSNEVKSVTRKKNSY